MSPIKMTIALLLIVTALSTARAHERVVIGFETSEGFPVTGERFTGSSTNGGIIERWTNDSTTKNQWLTEKGPGGVVYSNAPAPVGGRQLAVFGQGGAGVNIGPMHLNRRAA